MQLIIQYPLNRIQLLLELVVLQQQTNQNMDIKAEVVFLDLDHWQLLVVVEGDQQDNLDHILLVDQQVVLVPI